MYSSLVIIYLFIYLYLCLSKWERQGAFHYGKPSCQRPMGTQGKWNNKEEWPLPFFYSFSEFLTQVKRSNKSCCCCWTREMNCFVKNGKSNFSQNVLTKMSGTSPQVIRNIPVRRNWLEMGPFHLTSDQIFWNMWHNGKHPHLYYIWISSCNNSPKQPAHWDH